MRILLITENLGSGGAERQLTGLAVLLQQKGYQIRVLTYVKKQFYESYLNDNDIDYRLDTKIEKKSTRIYYLYKQLRDFKPDTVISFLPSTNISMCIVKLFYKTKLIISERSHTVDFNIKTKIRFLGYYLADKVVANSHSEAENIAKNIPFLRSKILAIPNFIDVDHFKPQNRIGENKILCVGRVIEVKNVLRLIDAVFLVKEKGYNFEITWIGHLYDQSYCKLVYDKIESYNLSNTFIVKDQSHNIIEEYNKADIFCLPSLFEGYPNVLCEAMSCGLPVICSNVCENPRIVINGENGFLFDPMDVNDIANSIMKMLDLSEKERFEMGSINRAKVIEQNSTEAFVERYMKIL